MPFQTHNPRKTDVWTPVRVELLLQLDAEDKLSRAEIAMEIGLQTGSAFTRNAIISKLAKLGMPAKEAGSKQKSRVWTPEHSALLLKLRADDLSASQIAVEIQEQTGMVFTRNAILGKIHRMGAPKKDRGISKAAQRRARPVPPPKAWKPQPTPRGPSPIAQDSLRLSMDDLTPTTCRYPTGPDGSPIEFCGHQVSQRSYCTGHYQICYYKPMGPNRGASLSAMRRNGTSMFKIQCEEAA